MTRSISEDVVIMTRGELKSLLLDQFQRGVKRGRFDRDEELSKAKENNEAPLSQL